MSEYTHIFLEKEGTFIEVSCTCRGNAISEMFDEYAPWEKIREITHEDLQQIYRQYNDELTKWKQHQKDLEERIKVIAAFNNSVDEKLEALHDNDESINETKETIDQLEYALSTVTLLDDILDGSERNVKYEQMAPVHIYAGRECGSNVTMDDVEGGTTN